MNISKQQLINTKRNSFKVWQNCKNEEKFQKYKIEKSKESGQLGNKAYDNFSGSSIPKKGKKIYGLARWRKKRTRESCT